MKALTDLQLTLWLKNIETEGKNITDIKSIIHSMTADELRDMIENATIKDWDIQDEDVNIVEQSWLVNVRDIVYDVEEDDYENKEEYQEFIDSLPKEISKLLVEDINLDSDDYDTCVYDAIADVVGVDVRSCNYDIEKRF